MMKSNNILKQMYSAFLTLIFMVSCANAQNYQGLIRVSPENPTEADEISVEFLSGCRSWENHQFAINGNQVDYAVDYLECVILPPPETFVPYAIGSFNAGDYVLNLSIRVNGGSQVDTLTIPFSVGAIRSVPMSIYAYMVLVCSMLFMSFFYYRQMSSMVDDET